MPLSLSAECYKSVNDLFDKDDDDDDDDESDDEEDNNDTASPIEDSGPSTIIAYLQQIIRTLNTMLSVPGLDDALAELWQTRLHETEAELEVAMMETQVAATAKQALRDLQALAKGTRRSVVDGTITYQAHEETPNCISWAKTAETALKIFDETAIIRSPNRTSSPMGPSTAESSSSGRTVCSLGTT